MKTKLYTLLFAVAVSVTNLFAEPVQIGDLYYSLNDSDLTAEVASDPSTRNFASIDIPSSVTYEGKSYSVTSLADYAFFSYTDLTNIAFPNSLIQIGQSTFDGCKSLVSVTLPEGITSIGEHAFDGCESLASVTIPASLTNIGFDAFGACFNLTTIYNYCTTPQTISENTFDVDQSAILYVPAQSVSLYQSAENWSKFANIQAIPGTEQQESYYQVKIDDLYYNLDPDTRTAEVTSTQDGQYAGDITIPSTVSYDGITYNVTSIGERAFYGCNVMMSVTIPNSVTSIGNTAFWGCSNLMSVELSDNVTSIGDGAFAECISMTSITIGKSVASIGISAFWQCYVLNITCKAVVPPAVDAQTFEGANKTMVLYVPAQSVATYQVTDGWKDFAGIQAIPGTEGTSTTPMFPGDPGTITYKLQLGAAVLGGDSLPDYTPAGAGGYAVGTSVTITAQDIPGYQFVQWSDGSTENPRSIVVNQSTSLTAYYSRSQIEIAVAANAWTFFCLPAVGKPYSEEMFEYVGLSNVKWGTYNGGTRASGKSGWETPESFNAQQGYIIYSTTAGTLRINAYETDLPSGDVSVSIVDYSSSQPENAGWNFLGNPYSQGYNIAGLAAAGIESPITVWNGTGYDTYTPGIDTYILQPFEAFFIQKAEGGVESVAFNPEYTEGYERPQVEGELPGLFSINPYKQVQFAKGNLQYQATTDTWRFAENQYDAIGEDNWQISETYSGWIDLFGWGTGDNPTKAAKTGTEYTTWVDWGVNAISNGGNTPDAWRTLSYDELDYILHNRTNAASLYGLGSVNGMNGLILLPDEWTGAGGLTFNPGSTGFSLNTYTRDQWSTMESAGAVFLPAAGTRGTASTTQRGQLGFYWTSTPKESYSSYYVCFLEGTVTIGDYTNFRGHAIRLVR